MRNKKTWIILGILLFITIFTCICGTAIDWVVQLAQGATGPVGEVEQFVNAMSAKDCDQLEAMMHPDVDSRNLCRQLNAQGFPLGFEIVDSRYKLVSPGGSYSKGWYFFNEGKPFKVDVSLKIEQGGSIKPLRFGLIMVRSGFGSYVTQVEMWYP